MARSSSGGAALCCVLVVLWMTSRLVVMGATPVEADPLRRCDTWAESDVYECLLHLQCVDAFSVLDKNQDRLISLYELNGVLEAFGQTSTDLCQLDQIADQVDSRGINNPCCEIIYCYQIRHYICNKRNVWVIAGMSVSMCSLWIGYFTSQCFPQIVELQFLACSNIIGLMFRIVYSFPTFSKCSYSH